MTTTSYGRGGCRVAACVGTVAECVGGSGEAAVASAVRRESGRVARMAPMYDATLRTANLAVARRARYHRGDSTTAMSPSPRRSTLGRLTGALTDNIVLRVALYYAVLFSAVALLWPHVPAATRAALLKS